MIGSFVLYATLCGGALASLPPAEKLEVTATVSGGSGLSVTGAGDTALVRRSPAFLLGEVGFVHPQLPWVEFSPAVQIELEGRVSVGLVPKVRLWLPGRRFRFFGILAVPAVVAPFTLLGVQLGAGVELRLHDHFGLISEGTGTAYVLGNDLVKGNALGKFDVVGGVRVHF